MTIKITLESEYKCGVDGPIRSLIGVLERSLKLDPSVCVISIPKGTKLPDKYKLGKEGEIYGLKVVESQSDNIELIGTFNLVG